MTMHRPRHNWSALLQAGFLLVLAAVGSLSVKPALSFPRSPFDCEKPPATSVLAWCEDKRKEWFKPLPTVQCEGRYKDGGKPTQEEFAKILESHSEWLAAYAGGQPSSPRYASKEARMDTRRANLCGADLRAIKLQGVDLRGANLQGANLTGRDLSGIHLEDANLREAILISTFLDGAYLRQAYIQRADFCGATLLGTILEGQGEVNLSRAGLYGTKLTGMEDVNLCAAALSNVDLSEGSITNAVLSNASLAKADLHGAILRNINLSRASLSAVNLQKTTLIDVDLTEASFLASLYPSDLNGLLIIGAKGLSTIKLWNPAEMVTLRRTLKESGLRSEERAITSALRKFELNTEPIHAQYFAYGVGGWITDFGADPWQSLEILGWSILGGAILYTGVLMHYERWHNSKKQAGIWAVWPTDRIHKAEDGEPARVTSTFFFPKWQQCAARKWWRTLLRGFCILLAGFYFSLLSAFHIGWRDLSVGTWISRLQPREYSLRAFGWVRFVSGAQSMLSMYLLAWWAVTYFGRPFE
jgi:uncharacterized protein YjbI with pentapeptide repeats